jgi:hypothetical protein
MEKYSGRAAASLPMTLGSLATPSGVRGGNSSKEIFGGTVMDDILYNYWFEFANHNRRRNNSLRFWRRKVYLSQC